MLAYLQGLSLGLAYVAPIGVQNLFVINAGLSQPRAAAYRTALIVIFFDVTLALAGFFGIGALIERYKEVQHDFHRGVILPVGDEPSGRSWTGFQSVDGERGYLIFFREQNPDRKARIETWLPENSKVRLTPVLGSGKAAVQKSGRRGTLEVELPAPNDYAMYRYELIR